MTEHDALLQLWDYMRLNQPVEKADVIVVPGCYDTDCALHAAELYHQGLAPVIVMSGGVKPKIWDNTQHHDKTEAEAFAETAIEAGVPADHILLENRATNTSENLWFTEELLKKHGISAQSVLLTQKTSFERRLQATAQHRWPGKTIMVTSRPVSMTDYFSATPNRHRNISSMVGDFQRLETYRGTYLKTDETIPTACWDAFSTLVQCGYTDYLCEPAETTLARIEKNLLSKETNHA